MEEAHATMCVVLFVALVGGDGLGARCGSLLGLLLLQDLLGALGVLSLRLLGVFVLLIGIDLEVEAAEVLLLLRSTLSLGSCALTN